MKNHFLEILKFNSKRYLEKVPNLYLYTAIRINQMRGHHTHRIVSKSSNICIEGFPRCANSFAVKAFRECSNEPLNIATHLHSHVNILRALRLKVPTLVLIRAPHECIISLRALIIEDAERRGVYPKLVPIQYEIKWYTQFYNSLLNKRTEFIISDFKTTISDFGGVINKFNLKYGTNYDTKFDPKALERKVFTKSSFHLSPSDHRENIKNQVTEEYFSEYNKNFVLEAEKVYHSFLEQCE